MHLESVCQRVAKMDRNKMFINFEITAMHLSSLLKVCCFPVISQFLMCCSQGTRLSRNGCRVGGNVQPVSLILLMVYSSICIFYHSNLKKLEDLSSRAGVHGLQFPLHLALAVSPCVLFLQTMLHKLEVGRLHLIEASPDST